MTIVDRHSGVAIALAVVIVGSTLFSGLALSNVAGRPNLALYAVDGRVTPGESTTLQVAVQNTGQILVGSNTSRGTSPQDEQLVTTARGVTLDMRTGGAPITVETDTVAAGSIPEGQAGPFSFNVTVDEDADPGTYRIPVNVSYQYTYRIYDEEATRSHLEANVSSIENVTIEVEDAPRFEVSDVSSDVAVGESGTVTVAIENVGTAPAREASVSIASTNPGVTLGAGGEQATSYVGAWEPGEVKRIPVEVSVDSAAERRQFALQTTVSYQRVTDDRDRTTQLTTGFTPEPEQRFRVEPGESSLRVDETGTILGQLVNAGPRAVSNAVLVFEAGEQNASAGAVPIETEYSLGEIEPGESRPFTYDLAVDSNAEDGPRQFSFHVEYRDEEGDRQRSDALDGRWIVRSKRDQFDVRNVDSTLQVDEQGRVTGQVVNNAGESVRDAVMVLQDPGTNATGSLSATETEYALGDLASGQAANFSFEVGVGAEADAGPRQFTFQIRYVDEDGETQQSGPVYTRVNVSEAGDEFTVRPVDASIPAGSTGVVRLEVTNVGDEPLSGVSAKLFVDDPLTADDDEAFIPALEANETATLAFRVSVAGGALPKVYPLSVDFEYEDAEGDTQLSDTYQVGLSVEERERRGFPGLPFAIAGGLVILLAGAAAMVIRR